MLQDWAPVLIFLIIVTGFGIVTLVMSYVFGVKKPDPTKLSPYECGMTPIGTARERFSVKFYLVALLFVVFDVETIFLFPWAVQFKVLGAFGLLEMLIFLGILVVAYIWIYAKGALEWV